VRYRAKTSPRCVRGRQLQLFLWQFLEGYDKQQSFMSYPPNRAFVFGCTRVNFTVAVMLESPTPLYWRLWVSRDNTKDVTITRCSTFVEFHCFGFLVQIEISKMASSNMPPSNLALVALIIAGTAGLGAETARNFAKKGFRVVASASHIGTE